jgi:hypothetical protein
MNLATEYSLFSKRNSHPTQKKGKKSHWLEYAALTASGWPAGRVFAQ